MEKLYKTYGELVEFRLIYINEAHPCDGGNPTPETVEKELFTHTSLESRREAARKFVKDKNVTIPCLIDNLDNAADLAYRAWPDKVYIVRSDGIVAFVGSDGPFGFPESMDVVSQWLQEYDLTGVEPPPLKGSLEDYGVIVAGEIQPFGHQDEILASLKRWKESKKAEADEEANLAESGQNPASQSNNAAPSPDDAEPMTSGQTNPVSNSKPSEVKNAQEPTGRVPSTSTMLLVGLALVAVIAIVLYLKQG